jgi:dUTP pyrophosphatase
MCTSLSPSSTSSFLSFRRLSQYALAPIRGSQHAAGYDLSSAYDGIVEAHGRFTFKTDLQIKLPVGCYGRIAPRSGLASQFFIDVGGGVVDPDYEGNVMVLLYNFSDTNYVVKRGDRIAQLICERINADVQLVEVSSNNHDREVAFNHCSR